MSQQTFGSVCIVLHGHLPYVLHHGSYPHGEAWLYEAAAETYLPLLKMLDRLAEENLSPGLTIGLTPILLEQLSHKRFIKGLPEYLRERIDRAGRDRLEFEKGGDDDSAALAVRWAAYYEERLAYFEKILRDIPGRFAEHSRAGRIEILTGPATHPYLPLLCTDECSSAQVVAGAATTKRRLGIEPTGIWLPECGYRPAHEDWKPVVLWNDPRYRPGIETYLAEAKLDHFFVDTHLATDSRALGTFDNRQFRAVTEEQAYWDKSRGWRNPMDPVGVASKPEAPKCFAMARHPRASGQVWSNVGGYPSGGAYLEFHRRHGDRGLRYHRVTDVKIEQKDKEIYDPAAAKSQIAADAADFCKTLLQTLSEHHQTFHRPGIITAPFDAELFGHWWFEGVEFLEAVLRNLAADRSVQLHSSRQVLSERPPTTVVRLPDGSWGRNGDATVWFNDQTKWIWEIEYLAESRLLGLLRYVPWQTKPAIEQMMQRAARQLLLMQASDWPFVIHSRGAPDYGAIRFAGHAERFSRMTAIAESLTHGQELDEVQKAEIADADLHDSVFPEIDLKWWKQEVK